MFLSAMFQDIALVIVLCLWMELCEFLLILEQKTVCWVHNSFLGGVFLKVKNYGMMGTKYILKKNWSKSSRNGCGVGLLSNQVSVCVPFNVDMWYCATNFFLRNILVPFANKNIWYISWLFACHVIGYE